MSCRGELVVQRRALWGVCVRATGGRHSDRIRSWIPTGGLRSHLLPRQDVTGSVWQGWVRGPHTVRGTTHAPSGHTLQQQSTHRDHILPLIHIISLFFAILLLQFNEILLLLWGMIICQMLYVKEAYYAFSGSSFFIPVLRLCIPPPSKMFCFSSCLFKAPPPEYPVCSDWSAHTRPCQQCLRQQSGFTKSVCTCRTSRKYAHMQLWHDDLRMSEMFPKITNMSDCIWLCAQS